MNDLTEFDPARLQAQFKMAEIMSKSRLVPSALQNRPQDILILLQQGKELDIPPMMAICGINVIQGKPTVSPQLMLALIYKKCPTAEIEINQDDKAVSVSVSMRRNRETKFHEVVWDMARATQMQLTGKDNWRKQPLTMLKWRAVSDAARVVFPDIIHGLYTLEEFDQKGTVEYSAEGEILRGIDNDPKRQSTETPVNQHPASPMPVKEETTAGKIIKIIRTLKGEEKKNVLDGLGIASPADLNGVDEIDLIEMLSWIIRGEWKDVRPKAD